MTRLAADMAFVTTHVRYVRTELDPMGIRGAVRVVWRTPGELEAGMVVAAPNLAWACAAAALRFDDRLEDIRRRAAELQTARVVAFTDEQRRVLN